MPPSRSGLETRRLGSRAPRGPGDPGVAPAGGLFRLLALPHATRIDAVVGHEVVLEDIDLLELNPAIRARRAG